MESPKPRRIGMRFVPRVDNRAFDHRIEVHETFEKVGALRDLIFSRAGLIFSSNFSCSGKDRSCDEKRRQHPSNPVERHGPRD